MRWQNTGKGTTLAAPVARVVGVHPVLCRHAVPAPGGQRGRGARLVPPRIAEGQQRQPVVLHAWGGSGAVQPPMYAGAMW